MTDKNTLTHRDFEQVITRQVESIKNSNFRNSLISAINSSVIPVIVSQIIFAVFFGLVFDRASIFFQLILAVIVVFGSIVIRLIENDHMPKVNSIFSKLDKLCNQHNIILNGYELACSGNKSVFGQAAIFNGYNTLINNAHLEIPVTREMVKWQKLILAFSISVLLGSLDGFWQRTSTSPLDIPEKQYANNVSNANANNLQNESPDDNTLSPGRSVNTTHYQNNNSSQQTTSQTTTSTGSSIADSGPLATSQFNSNPGSEIPLVEALGRNITDDNDSTIQYTETSSSQLNGNGAPGKFSLQQQKSANNHNRKLPKLENMTIDDSFYSESISGAMKNDSGYRITEINNFSSQSNNNPQPQMTETGPAPLRTIGMLLSEKENTYNGYGDIEKDKIRRELMSVLPGKIIPVLIKGTNPNSNNRIIYQSVPTKVIGQSSNPSQNITYQPDNNRAFVRYRTTENKKEMVQKYFKLLRDE